MSQMICKHDFKIAGQYLSIQKNNSIVKCPGGWGKTDSQMTGAGNFLCVNAWGLYWAGGGGGLVKA